MLVVRMAHGLHGWQDGTAPLRAVGAAGLRMVHGLQNCSVAHLGVEMSVEASGRTHALGIFGRVSLRRIIWCAHVLEPQHYRYDASRWGHECCCSVSSRA